MEISLPMSGVFQFSQQPAVKTASTDFTPITTSQTATNSQVAAVSSGTAASPTTADNSAHEAASSFKDTYAVSDSVSSGYKDANGTLITITRDYRTGKVTYAPEPAYIKSPESSISLIA